MNGKAEQTGSGMGRGRPRERRTGRLLAVFKSLVLVALIAITAYGMLNKGLFGVERWMPVAIGVLALLLATLFSPGFYRDVPRVGWFMVMLLAVLVGIKGLSLTWSISETETIQELLRSAMYLATFVMALAALSSSRQVSPLMDAAILISTAVAGYGIMQKINPVEFPATMPDAARIGSTLEYANTTAMVVGMGAVLALARMTEMRSILGRGTYAVLILLFGTTLYFTFSRGGLLALGLGLVVLFVLGGNRLQTFANFLLVSGPLIWLLYRAQSLDALFRGEAAESQRLLDGLTLRNDLLVAAAAALLLQAVYAFLVNRYELMPAARRGLGAVALTVVLLLGGVGTFVVGKQLASGDISRAISGRIEQSENANERLTSLSSNSRSQYWQVAWNEWMERPLLGTGAGTFQYTWLEDRPGFGGVKQVHNVYLEQGTETGVFAFLALTGFAALLAGYAARATWRSRPLGDRRVLLSGLTATVMVYLSSSALEWHWYIPPSTLFFFVLAGITVKFAARTDWEQPEKDASSASERSSWNGKQT